jgi:glycosyltransferase involved in cell wall biosynthesis
MNSENLSKLESSIQNLKEKTARIYFFVQDTKGNARASIANIYRMALTLKNNGFNPIILHEKNDYVGVSTWLGEEYMVLDHKSLENQNLEVSPEDFLIVPELFGYVMVQVAKLPCAKIVYSQAYDHIFETLQPGESWAQMGFLKCITTSEKQKEYLDSVMKNISFDVLTPQISETFTKQELPAKPIIAIHSRDQRDSINLIKSFYVRYPQYRWVTFRDMRGMSESEFANALKDCFLSVWIDPTSGFGTFPLESMKCGVPVIGQIPNIVPEWMNEENGLWIQNKVQILDFIVDFLHNWLEDGVQESLYEGMEKTVKQYSKTEDYNKKVVNLFENYINVRLESFESQLNKLKTEVN